MTKASVWRYKGEGYSGREWGGGGVEKVWGINLTWGQCEVLGVSTTCCLHDTP